MDKAKKQAEQIPEDKRQEAIIDNLKKATATLNDSSKILDEKIIEANQVMNDTISKVGGDHQQMLADIVVKSNKLLAQLKSGADVNDIVSKIKNLKPK
ncbi:MAG: hypothetical protein GTO02_01400 [Candidatus Dadabacteria bacterium]|nr:hypothetical protein [Candidatus Dadabacteria bacterium]